MATSLHLMLVSALQHTHTALLHLSPLPTIHSYQSRVVAGRRLSKSVAETRQSLLFTLCWQLHTQSRGRERSVWYTSVVTDVPLPVPSSCGLTEDLAFRFFSQIYSLVSSLLICSGRCESFSVSLFHGSCLHKSDLPQLKPQQDSCRVHLIEASLIQIQRNWETWSRSREIRAKYIK